MSARDLGHDVSEDTDVEILRIRERLVQASVAGSGSQRFARIQRMEETLRLALEELGGVLQNELSGLSEKEGPDFEVAAQSLEVKLASLLEQAKLTIARPSR